jgi:PAS domain S-box-containing protein
MSLLFLVLNTATILGVVAGSLLLLWLISLLFFERYRRRTKRKFKKMLGLITVKNSHDIKVLKESEAKFKAVTDLMNEGLLMTDDKHMIVYANKAACRKLKRNQDDIIGSRLIDYAAGNAEATKIIDILKKTKPGSKAREEFHLVRGDKELFWASLSFSHPKTLTGLNNSTIIVMVDVTQHIIQEQKMRKLTNNLVQKVKQLNCVFDMQQMLAEPNQSTERLLQRALSIIPQGLRYEKDMRVEIVYEGEKFHSPGYHQTKLAYKVPLKSGRQQMGHIAVSYVGARTPRQSQPFRIGEKILLKNLAEKIVTALELKKHQ